MRRIVLTLLALAVLLPSTAFARGRYSCEVDQIVRESCCCPPKKASPDPVQVPRMQRDCCKIVQHAPGMPSVATTQTASRGPAPVAIMVTQIAPAVSARDVRPRLSPRAQAPPLLGSLLSRRSSFLL